MCWWGVGDDGGVQERTDHHRKHEGREYDSQWEGRRLCSLLQCGDPNKNEEVHRSLETGLSETQNEQERIYGGLGVGVHTQWVWLTRFDNIPGLAQPSQLEDATIVAGGSSTPILMPCAIDGNPRQHEQNTAGNER